MHVPKEGARVKLIPTDEELKECRTFGRQIAEVLVSMHRNDAVMNFADQGQQVCKAMKH